MSNSSIRWDSIKYYNSGGGGVNLEAMAIKGYSAISKPAALLEPHYIQCHIQYIRWEGLTPLQKYSRCILQPPAVWAR